MAEFSVLMSVYIKEKVSNLEESIFSVYNQSLVPNEIVLVKDGELNDELENCIFRLKKLIPILKVVGYKENKGLGYSLNYGLNLCSNELVFRMDTDDISHPNRFKIQLKYLDENPNISIIGSRIEEFNEIPGDLKHFRNVPLTSENIERFKTNRNPFNHMTVLYKKSVIHEVGGYKHMPGYEDYYLWMRLLRENKGMNITEALVFARIGNDMINRRHGFEFFMNEIEFQYKLFREGYISPIIFLRNIILRGLPRLLPKSILKIIYTKILRR